MTYPVSNLPPKAVTWGRAVERAFNPEFTGAARSQNSLNNSDRATSGSLSVLGDQITELSNWVQVPVEVPGMSVSATVAPSSQVNRFSSQAVALTTPDGKARRALFIISGFWNAEPESMFFGAGISFRVNQNGFKRFEFLPAGVQTPEGWGATFRGMFEAVVAPGSELLVDLSCRITNPSTSITQTGTAEAAPISCVVSYGGTI